MVTVKRGIKNVMEVGSVVAIDGKPEMTFWRDSCNQYSGTDGTVFPPFLTEKDRLESFSGDMCRLVHLLAVDVSLVIFYCEEVSMASQLMVTLDFVLADKVYKNEILIFREKKTIRGGNYILLYKVNMLREAITAK